MKNKIAINSIFIATILTSLSSCAAGSATAAYSITARSAENLTSEAEDRIVKRAKAETMQELSSRGMFKDSSN